MESSRPQSAPSTTPGRTRLRAHRSLGSRARRLPLARAARVATLRHHRVTIGYGNPLEMDMSITFADFRSGSRRRTRTPVHLTAAQYALQWGWAAVPGARLVRGDSCSCGDRSCPAPGAHPLAGAGVLEPGSSVDEAR